MVTLSRLFIHPVKSMRGIGLTHAFADISGLAFDRLFMVTETDGTFITARQFPQMVKFIPAPLHDGLHLTAPDGSSAVVRFSDFATQAEPTEVWGNHFTALIAPAAVNQWLSGFFKRDVQLRWLGPQLTRRVKRHDAVPLSFADGYPYLLANEASLRDLQQRCPASVSIEQFRPNLVVTGAAAWDEDSWKVIRIGEVVFDVAKPCSRCIFTTVSPERGQKHPAGEPLETLKRFRTALDNGDVDFGQNLIARNSGVIRWEMKWKSLPAARRKPTGQVKATIPRLPRRSSRLRLPSNGRVNSLPAITSRCCWSNWNNRAFAYPIRVGRGSAAAAASGWKREK